MQTDPVAFRVDDKNFKPVYRIGFFNGFLNCAISLFARKTRSDPCSMDSFSAVTPMCVATSIHNKLDFCLYEFYSTRCYSTSVSSAGPTASGEIWRPFLFSHGLRILEAPTSFA